MRPGTLLVFSSVVLLLSACTTATAQPATPESFATVCDRSNEGLNVILQGYLRLPDSLDGNTYVMLRLYPSLSFHRPVVGVNMRFGNAPNEVRQITSSYRDTDLLVRLSDGTMVPFRTKVQVSGRVAFPTTPLDFDCQLDDPLVQKAK